jgi:hypothetical protein
MAETGTPDQPPAGLLAALLAEPPATLFSLALRWVPVAPPVSCRIAALACALLKAPVNLAAARPADEPGGKFLTEFEEWLRGGKDSTTVQVTTRIFCLYFACQLTPPAPESADAARKQVIASADWLMGWFETGKLRRRGAWRLS